jgi:hypothetical protein
MTMETQAPTTSSAPRREPWNKGKLIGQKPRLRPKHVWSIRTRLQMEGRTRDLAMFNLAIDSKLRGCDVVAIRVEDVAPSEKFVRCGFWGLNIGLAMMILFSLFPSGLLQVRDVLENGYWHARSLDYLGGALPRLLEWLRLPATWSLSSWARCRSSSPLGSAI